MIQLVVSTPLYALLEVNLLSLPHHNYTYAEEVAQTLFQHFFFFFSFFVEKEHHFNTDWKKKKKKSLIFHVSSYILCVCINMSCLHITIIKRKYRLEKG